LVVSWQTEVGLLAGLRSSQVKTRAAVDLFQLPAARQRVGAGCC
jgi:hypothetical protein